MAMKNDFDFYSNWGWLRKEPLRLSILSIQTSNTEKQGEKRLREKILPKPMGHLGQL